MADMFTSNLSTQVSDGGKERQIRSRFGFNRPATPTVGLAYLKAFEATGDDFYLLAALDAGDALAFGQLRTGGWQNQIDMKGVDKGHPYSGGRKRLDEFSSLDDGQSQTAIQFMVKLDKAMRFRDEDIHNSALFALDSLLAAQFPKRSISTRMERTIGETSCHQSDFS